MSMTTPSASSRSEPSEEELERDVSEVHPDLQDLFRTVRPMLVPDLTKSAAERRAIAEAGPGITANMVEVVDLHEVRDLEIPVDGAVLPARLHRPTADAVLPGHVHFHGGGWILGSVESSDPGVRMFASRMSAAVVSVGYRLAPEHKWPIPPEDCFAATRWVHEHAAELGIDADDLSVGGDSAGGNLAAVVALMARDRGGPSLVAQWLMIGAYDLTLPDSPSLERYGKGFVLDRDEVGLCLDWYTEPHQRLDPYVSPIHGDLTGLPPAVVTSAGCDPLYDQSLAYAERLRAAGVEVSEVRCAGHLHGSLLLTDYSESARQNIADSVAALLAARRR